MAWLLRLKKRLLQIIRNSSSKGDSEQPTRDLTVDELKAAEIEIVKYVQKQLFSDELKTLKSAHGHLKKLSPLSRLEPIMSPSGVLCVGGRLEQASIVDEAKHPMILPKDHHIVNLIIDHYHHEAGHSGREHVLALLRQRSGSSEGDLQLPEY